MNWNLRNRILMPILGLILALLLVTGLVSYRMSTSALDLSTDAQLERICTSGLREVESWIHSQRFLVQQWAVQPQLLAALDPAAAQDPVRRSLDRQFAEAVRTNGTFEAIHVFNARGLAVASSIPDAVGRLDVSERAYFKDVAAGRPVISQVLKSIATGQPIVVVAHPVMDGTTVRGCVLISLDLSAFSTHVIAQVKVLETGYAFMTDGAGVFIAHPNKDRILQTRLSDFAWGPQVLQQRNGEIHYTFEGVDKMAFFRTSTTLGWSLVATVPMAEVTAAARHMAWLNAGLGLGALAIAGLLLWFIARSITRPVQQVAAQLSSGSDCTAGAASQVSTASQALATGSTEQAAALEETSASLVEMSGMTKRNAENSVRAAGLAREARQAVDTGMADIQAMGTAMRALKSSSDDIAKIVKTIDEIAFQTNILALNAAVEAARAGEAGAGFAVVAEEVRALAQRSATAARETADKIEGAITRTAQGVTLSNRVAGNLTDLVAKIRQVDQLIAEVSNASREQTEGVNQINSAVSEMDKVVQGNAAAAEESAAAAEELNAQAARLRESARSLACLVDGRAETPDTPAAGSRASGRPTQSASLPDLIRSTPPVAVAAQRHDPAAAFFQNT